MGTSVLAPPPERDADNVLYDSGADLVQAAASMARAAAKPEAARAMPAALGCIEAALQELLIAAVGMEATTARTMKGGGSPRAQAVEGRMHQGFANLQRALDDAKDAAAASRSLASRALETVGGTVRRPRSRR
jgi:hypothetical protein